MVGETEGEEKGLGRQDSIDSNCRQELGTGRLNSVGEEDGGAVDFPIPFGEGHGETGNVGAACCCGVQRWACGSTSGSARRCETA